MKVVVASGYLIIQVPFIKEGKGSWGLWKNILIQKRRKWFSPITMSTMWRSFVLTPATVMSRAIKTLCWLNGCLNVGNLTARCILLVICVISIFSLLQCLLVRVVSTNVILARSVSIAIVGKCIYAYGRVGEIEYHYEYKKSWSYTSGVPSATHLFYYPYAYSIAIQEAEFCVHRKAVLFRLCSSRSKSGETCNPPLQIFTPPW